jgi:hypothetical protein
MSKIMTWPTIPKIGRVNLQRSPFLFAADFDYTILNEFCKGGLGIEQYLRERW